MALKAFYSKADEIPADLAAFYVEKDGKFVLDLEGDAPANDSSALQRALAHERKQRQDAIRARDDAAARVQAMEEKLAALEQKATDNPSPENDRRLEQFKTEMDKRILQLEKLATDERTKREQAELNLAEQSLLEQLRGSAAPLIREEAIPHFLDAVARKHFKRMDDGRFVPHDENGPLYSKKDPTKIMTPSEYIETLAADPSVSYMRKQSQGTGAQGGGRAAQMNGNTMVISREVARDVNAYRAAREQATKAGVTLEIAPQTAAA